MTTIRTTTLGALCLTLAGAAAMTLGLDAGPVTSGAAATSNEMVPVELVLLVDTSGSVDSNEYRLQRDGYVSAFSSDELGALVEQLGGVAVLYVEWSNTNHQSIRLGWRRLDTAADCRSYATDISLITRSASGETMLAPALDFAMTEIAENNYTALKRVIDVSGDGVGENWEFHYEGVLTQGRTDEAFYGTPWDDVVDALETQNTQVNGICIGTSRDLVDFYTDILPQGSGAFMMQVDGFSQFAEGIKSKLINEITVIPTQFD